MDFLKKLCGDGGPSSPHRRVLLQPSEQELNTQFPDNAVYTYKYNVATFIPRSLFEQFRRLANVYFLVISLLMVIGTFTSLFDSPLTPYSTLLPLMMVLAITMAKEGFEDVKRHNADNEVNNREVKALVFNDGGATVMKKWIDLRVGDMLVIEDRQEIAADVVVLATSDETGTCYVETSNIDGETNLKSRKVAPTGPGGVGSRFESLADLAAVRGTVECEHPNADIHHFLGNVMLSDLPGEQVSVDASNLLLRGSTLRNTRWAAGVVVYTGTETKIVMNSSDPPSKLSNMESTVNTMVWIILFAQAVLSAISVVAFVIWKSLYEEDTWYLCESGDDAPTELFREDCDDTAESSEFGQYFTFIILYNNFIPISLYVTIEMVNYVQALWLDWDIEMYHEETDTPALCRSSGACADLGMIEYIFSDKTGTLTRNVMEFRRCSVASTVYGAPPENDEAGDLPDEIAAAKPSSEWTGLDALVAKATTDPTSAEYEFVLSMAIAHTVVLEKGDDGKEELQAESPDEEALVKGGTRLGVEFRGKDGNSAVVSVNGEERAYEILAIIPFNSTRKRMSVMVKTPEGKYVLLCKGADSIILDPEGERPSRTKDFMSGHSEATLKDHLNVFAADGLRTLVLAKRELSGSEYKKWAAQWQEANVSVTEREELRTAAAKVVEQNLTVIGATAIEDKLQEGVPQCIADLADAGIKLWVLTGDKMETAINIGFSARLLTAEMTMLKIKYDDEAGPDVTKAKVRRLISHFNKLSANPTGIFGRVRRGLTNAAQTLTGHRDDDVEPDPMPNMEPTLDEQESEAISMNDLSTDYLALVIDGPSLTVILRDHDLSKGFLDLACLCKVVVACRVSPAQKAEIVRLVKRGLHPTPMTLAIGDGANDVGMIQAAAVGVGISGKEGRQAVNSSDFAIAQFRFLRSLTLIHGRWNYRRISKTILYSFYKNIVLTFILFFYQFACGFSGQSLFESYVYAGYNFFLGMPPLIIGLFDKDVSKETVLQFKSLYYVGRQNLDLNVRTTVGWILQAGFISLIIYLLVLGAYYWPHNVWDDNGETSGLWVFGTTVYSALLASMLYTAASITHTWNRYVVASFIFSIWLYFFFLCVYTLWYYMSPDFYFVAYEMMALGIFWMAILLVSTTTLMSEISVQMITHMFFPNKMHHAMEYDRGYGDGAKPEPVGDADVAAVQAEEGKTGDPAGPSDRPSEMPTGGKFMLDRESLFNLNAGLTEEEKEDMGIIPAGTPHMGSTFNFDYVTDQYGVGGGGSSLLEADVVLQDVEEDNEDEEIRMRMSMETAEVDESTRLSYK